MIADSSAWIEYLRGTGSAVHLALAEALKARRTVWLPDVVYQEVLQGARSPMHFIELQRLLDQFEPPALPEPRDLLRVAAGLYARCRWAGRAIRSPNDCVVAACCIVSGLPLLALDRDFATLAAIEPRLRRLAV